MPSISQMHRKGAKALIKPSARLEALLLKADAQVGLMKVTLRQIAVTSPVERSKSLISLESLSREETTMIREMVCLDQVSRRLR